jgi:hypothetical protein
LQSGRTRVRAETVISDRLFPTASTDAQSRERERTVIVRFLAIAALISCIVLDYCCLVPAASLATQPSASWMILEP